MQLGSCMCRAWLLALRPLPWACHSGSCRQGASVAGVLRPRAERLRKADPLGLRCLLCLQRPASEAWAPSVLHQERRGSRQGLGGSPRPRTQTQRGVQPAGHRRQVPAASAPFLPVTHVPPPNLSTSSNGRIRSRRLLQPPLLLQSLHLELALSFN